MRTAKVEAGATVAVFGLGAVGMAVIQGAVLKGASRIVGIDVNPNKFLLAKSLGRQIVSTLKIINRQFMKC